MKRLNFLAFILVPLLVLSAACERKPEDLEAWRKAQGGMEKMREWATSAEEPKEVRIRAIEIMVEEGETNALQPTLEGVEDDALRAEMVAAAMPIVEKMWQEQDMPVLTEEMKKKGGQMPTQESESVKAKDAAYFLHPFAKSDQKEKLEAILGEWMSTDWQLRNQLGNTTLGQLAPRAGKQGGESLVMWLEEAVQPHTVAKMISEHGDDEIKEKAAVVLRGRAEEAHPELSSSLDAAVLTFQHRELTPYLKKAVTDPNSPETLIDGAMDALVRNEGERAAPFFTDLVKTKPGLLRWVAATRLVEVLGKPSFTYVATGLPVEMDTYPSAEEASLRDDTAYFCKMYQGEMGDAGIKTVSDQLSRGLESSRWPARALALQCARVFKSKDLEATITALDSDRQSLPGWGGDKTVGELAGEVLEDLSKS